MGGTIFWIGFLDRVRVEKINWTAAHIHSFISVLDCECCCFDFSPLRDLTWNYKPNKSLLTSREQWNETRTINNQDCNVLLIHTVEMQPMRQFWKLSLFYMYEQPFFLTCDLDFSCEDITCYLIFTILYMWVFCLHVCLCTMCIQYSQRPEDGVGSPGTGVTNACELP